MRCLLLSDSTGLGHDKARDALKERLEELNVEVVTKSFLKMESAKYMKQACNLYINTVNNNPNRFGIAYKLGEIISNKYIKSPVYLRNIKTAKELKKYLDKEPFDFIISTHLFSALGLTYLKNKGLTTPFFYVATDYTAIPFSEEVKSHLYFISHKELVDEFVKKGVSKDIIRPYGIPTLKKFNNDIEKHVAKEMLNLTNYNKIYTIMGGSMGYGIEKLLDKLVPLIQESDLIIVLAGNNQKLKKEINNNYPKVLAQGFTKDIDLFIKSSDVFFSKPGGLSSTEIVVANTPLVHIEPIPGCETKNKELFNKLGISVSGDTPDENALLGISLANDKDLQQKMINNQQKHINKNTTNDIVNAIMEYVYG